MRVRDGRVVPAFIQQALTGEPMTVFGDGSQTRSFCYVDDLIRGFLAAMDTPPDFTGPVNLGNPDEFTIRALAETVIAMTGSRSQIVAEPLPVDDPRRRRPDITLARDSLGWQPQVGLREGLASAIRFFEQELGIAGASPS
jgi:UDP-glucuronate decarboxylase